MTFETREPSDPRNESPAWIRLTLPPKWEPTSVDNVPKNAYKRKPVFSYYISKDAETRGPFYSQTEISEELDIGKGAVAGALQKKCRCFGWTVQKISIKEVKPRKRSRKPTSKVLL